MMARVLPGIVGRKGMAGGASIVTLVVGACILVPMLISHDANDIIASPLQAPSWEFPFGTDGAGRDVFLRTFQAGRLNLSIAAVTIAISCLIGTMIGAISGSTKSRALDGVLMRVVDAIIAVPFVVFILALIAVLGETRELFGLPAGTGSLCIAIIAVNWVVYARLARAQTLTMRERDYVLAAQVIGYSRLRVLWRHVLPQVWRTTCTFAVADLVLMIVVTSGLSFIGAGVQPPTADWGSIMYEGRGLLANAWWISLIPGALIVMTGLGVTLVADGLLAERKALG